MQACVVLPAAGPGTRALSRGTGMCLYGHGSREALGSLETVEVGSLLLGSLHRGMNRKYCLPAALVCSQIWLRQGKGGEGRERWMSLRFSGLRFLHLLSLEAFVGWVTGGFLWEK